MKHSQTIGIISVLLLLATCALPWIYIPSLQITLNGLHGKVNDNLTFGMQLKAYLFFSVFLIPFFIGKSVLVKRINIFIGLLNLGWCIKNYILFSMCRLGECPQIKTGLYAMLVLGFVIQIMTFLPKISLSSQNK